MARLSTLGVEVLVFGSGGARRVPDGFDRGQAWTQLVDFSRRAADAARPYKITVAIEPLRQQETNIINTAAEGLELVNAVNHPNFQLMIDFYHLASEHEDPAIVLEAKDHCHLHVANPNAASSRRSGRVRLRAVLRQPEGDGTTSGSAWRAIRRTWLHRGRSRWRFAQGVRVTNRTLSAPGPARQPDRHRHRVFDFWHLRDGSVPSSRACSFQPPIQRRRRSPAGDLAIVPLRAPGRISAWLLRRPRRPQDHARGGAPDDGGSDGRDRRAADRRHDRRFAPLLSRLPLRPGSRARRRVGAVLPT